MTQRSSKVAGGGEQVVIALLLRCWPARRDGTFGRELAMSRQRADCDEGAMINRGAQILKVGAC